jgi:hypothetical protein
MKKKRLSDTYAFSGYVPREKVIGIFGDSRARVVRLERTGKKLSVAHAELLLLRSMTEKTSGSVTFPAATLEYILKSRSDGFSAGLAAK